MKALNVTPELQASINEWKTAKENEKGWADYRKAQEEIIMASCAGDFDAIVKGLESSTSLTTTVELGDLKVTLGSSMSVTQVGATEFLQHYPTMQNILFKQEFKAVAKPILTTVTGPENEMSKMLDEIIEFKPKRPGFALK